MTPSKVGGIDRAVSNQTIPPPQTPDQLILEKLDDLAEQLNEINERLLNMSLGRYNEDD